MTQTYTVNTRDTDTRQVWMDSPAVIDCRIGQQDSGRCSFTVTTTDAAALESALDADDDVLDYQHLLETTVRHIAYWLDTTSDPADPHWIVTLESADETITLHILPSGATEQDAQRTAEQAARQRSLPVERAGNFF